MRADKRTVPAKVEVCVELIGDEAHELLREVQKVFCSHGRGEFPAMAALETALQGLGAGVVRL